MEYDFDELIKLIETKEITQLKNWCRNKEENIYDFAPVNSQGSPDTDLEARPTIRFKVDFNNRSFILSWIYLKNTGQRLGREIFGWIIDFCRNNGFKTFEVRCVGKDKVAMRQLCKHFGFTTSSNQNGYDNFMLRLND